PSVSFASASSSGSEGTTSVSIPVNLLAGGSQTVTVNYAVTGGTATGGGVDYTLASGTLTFAPGQTTQNITISVVDDLLIESSETVVVTLSAPTNATLGTNTTHTYTITDNDPTPVVSNLIVSGIGTQGAVVTWTTDAASTSR